MRLFLIASFGVVLVLGCGGRRGAAREPAMQTKAQACTALIPDLCARVVECNPTISDAQCRIDSAAFCCRESDCSAPAGTSAEIAACAAEIDTAICGSNNVNPSCESLGIFMGTSSTPGPYETCTTTCTGG